MSSPSTTLVKGEGEIINQHSLELAKPANPMSPARSGSADIDSPYVIGRVMKLISQDGVELEATIIQTWPITMQPVMKVMVAAHNGAKMAILKLYDRRFGPNRERVAYTLDLESAFQEYIQSGKAEALIKHLQAEEDADKPINADEAWEFKPNKDEEDDEDLPEREEFAQSEVNAYSQLKPLQGRCIPRWIASVKSDSLPNPKNLPASYFEVPGILVEYVPGFSLRDLVEELPNEPELWDDIVHDAVNTTKLVNDNGVFHADCQPRNFIVQPVSPRKYQTFLIDFAKCYFKSEYKDTDDPEDDRGFLWQITSSGNNAEEISVIMAGKVLGLTEVKLNFPFHFLE